MKGIQGSPREAFATVENTITVGDAASSPAPKRARGGARGPPAAAGARPPSVPPKPGARAGAALALRKQIAALKK